MPAAPAPAVDVSQHLQWCRKIGRWVADCYHFRRHSQEEADLVSVAYLHCCRAATRYTGDPADSDHFRGYAYRTVVAECRREARRLRNGGTYHTRAEHHHAPLEVEPLSVVAAGRGGEEWEPAAKESAPAFPWA